MTRNFSLWNFFLSHTLETFTRSAKKNRSFSALLFVTCSVQVKLLCPFTLEIASSIVKKGKSFRETKRALISFRSKKCIRNLTIFLHLALKLLFKEHTHWICRKNRFTLRNLFLSLSMSEGKNKERNCGKVKFRFPFKPNWSCFHWSEFLSKGGKDIKASQSDSGKKNL